MATARKRPKNPNIDLGRMASELAESQKPSSTAPSLSQQAAEEVVGQSVPTEAAVKHPGGRPKNTVPTTKMVVYLSGENAKRVKHFAVEHETKYSKVIDSLVTQYLDDLVI